MNTSLNGGFLYNNQKSKINIPKSKINIPKSKSKAGHKKGGSLLADVSVPASFLLLNQFFKNRKIKSKKFKKNKSKKVKSRKIRKN